MVLDLQAAQQAATVALNVAAAVAVGAALSLRWLSQRATVWATSRLARLRLSLGLALIVAVLASSTSLWLESAAMAEVQVQDAWPAVYSMVASTHFGFAWSLGIAALFLAALYSAYARGGLTRYVSPMALLSLCVFLYTRSMISHAASEGDFSAKLMVDWIHLVLICVWVGEVVAAGLFVLPGHGEDGVNDRRDRALYIEALSTSATVALSGIVATGLFSAWKNLGSFDSLGGDYGLVLQVKLALVSLAVLLGGANRFLVMPALVSGLKDTDRVSTSTDKFVTILRIELLVLVAVLALAAILSSTSPPTAL